MVWSLRICRKSACRTYSATFRWPCSKRELRALHCALASESAPDGLYCSTPMRRPSERLCSCGATLVLLCQQQRAAIADRGLRNLGKALQQPGQRHFNPHMIVGDIDIPGSRLPERANAKEHMIASPGLFVHRQYRYAGSRARQPSLEAARRLFAANAMRNGYDERCGHDL